MPEGTQLTIGAIKGIPLYDGDAEAADGVPQVVAALKDAIAATDGLLLATPGSNNSVPGVFKNAIDWLSQPCERFARIFGGKPTAIIGASPGGFGTILAQAAWLPILRTLQVVCGMGYWFLVSRSQGVFDTLGAMIDAGAKEPEVGFVADHAGFVA